MEHYLGAKIKELRQGRNWTQSYLAARLNKSVSTVSGYESDAHPIPTDVRLVLQSYLAFHWMSYLILKSQRAFLHRDCQFHR